MHDALKLKKRQETDTIDIVDELRYCINEAAENISVKKSSYIGAYEREEERNRKLNLINSILRELNLEC
jgi:primase-polymerase (primpol)-like protein